MGVCLAGEAAGQPSEDYKKHVVEIYNQNKVLIGTGTSIAFQGLILTAKHILEAPADGARAPDYLLNVLIRPFGSQDYRQVELLVTHPFMDLAVLIDRKGGPLEPLAIGKSADVASGRPIVIIGHQRHPGPREPELYKVRDTVVDEVNRHGNIIVGRGVEQTTSGGPAIYDGRLIGVVRSTAIDTATVVPLDGARDYLRLRGVVISETGFAGIAGESEDMARLVTKISRYERLLADIQLDVAWKAEVTPTWPSGRRGPFPDDFTLSISYEKKLDAQPAFAARISVEATPIFEGTASRALGDANRPRIPRADWLPEGQMEVRFRGLGYELSALFVSTYSRLGITKDHFRGFDIVAHITSIVGDALPTAPEGHAVCFSLRFASGGARLTEPVREVGRRCVPQGDVAGRGAR